MTIGYELLVYKLFLKNLLAIIRIDPLFLHQYHTSSPPLFPLTHTQNKDISTIIACLKGDWTTSTDWH